MATSYTTLLGLALPVQGELVGTWGDTVNISITNLLDTAIAGTTTLNTDADVTLTTTVGAANQARSAVLLCTGARTALRNITAPAQSKVYTIINSTTGGFAVVIRGVGPTTGVSVAAGTTATVAWNGSDFVAIGSNTPYPGAGIANSTGSAWGTSYTTTGSGTVLALATSPTLVTPVLGTPTSGTLTNCTGLPLNALAAAAASSTSTLANTNSRITWQFNDATASRTSFTITEAAASTAGAGSQILASIGTLAGSTADPLQVQTRGVDTIRISRTGAVTITGLDGTTGSGTTGSAINLVGGQGASTSVGGDVTLTAGAGGSTSGNGGALTLASGGGVSGTGGAVSITSGGPTTGQTGTVTLTSGAVSANSNNSGTLTINSGNSTATGGNTGNVVVSSGACVGGSVAGSSGSMTVRTGNNTGSFDCGTLALTGGSATSGIGGAVTITAGNSGGAAGANVTVTAGNGTTGTLAGGNVNLVPGTASTTGVPGEVQVNGNSGTMHIPVALTATDVTRTVFIATRPCRLKAVSTIFGTASSSGTLQLSKDTGTTAAGAGTALLTGTIALSGTANTVSTGTLSSTVATITLATGDRIAIVIAGTMTGLVGGFATITVTPT